MFASIASQGLGECQRRPDRDVQCVDEREGDGDGDYRGRRDGSADTLSFADYTDDRILDDDAVEPPASDTERIGNDDGAVSSQIISAQGESL